MYEVTKYKEYFPKTKTNCEQPYEMNNADRIEAAEIHKRMRFVEKLMIAQDLQDRADKEARGYCPHCHILLPLTGECDICGYIKPKAQPNTNIKPTFFARLAKIKGEFAE